MPIPTTNKTNLLATFFVEEEPCCVFILFFSVTLRWYEKKQ